VTDTHSLSGKQVLAVVEATGVEDALAALAAIGHHRVEVLRGESGIDHLDRSEERPPVVGAIAKAVSVFGGEQLELEVYERELAAGKAVLVVGVDAEEDRVEVADALRQLGATNLLYHGDWTFESLGD
jgi:hypothetical protein